MHSSPCFQLLGRKLLTVSLQKLGICLKESSIFLTRSPRFLVFFSLFPRKREELVLEGSYRNFVLAFCWRTKNLLLKELWILAFCASELIIILNSSCRELEKITIPGDDLYLPTATNKLVRGIQLDSGIPLQSAAKVPIMITFNVIDRDGNPNDVKPQACIFKVNNSLVAIKYAQLMSCVGVTYSSGSCAFIYYGN